MWALESKDHKTSFLLVLTEIIHGNFLSSILNITLYKLKKTSFILMLFLFMGCKHNAELSMERGIQFYEWNKIEEAIIEFKYVIHEFNPQTNKLKHKEIKLLSRAHHNLAVAYAKKKWYTDAVEEAKKAFELFPTDDNRKVLELIKIKMFQKTELRLTPGDSINQ
tara:strand:+ start:524 stop:1018 length:495 start_codon:yes stop_codon:yes gene_type:complete